MEADTPTLEVGFTINVYDSFGQLKTLDDIIGSVAAESVRNLQRVEQASKGAINFGGGIAQVKTFGNAVNREMANVARDTNRAEKAGETMLRQLERQATQFGKTREELRSMRSEEKALAAERTGNTVLAQEIRAAELRLYEMEFAAQRKVAQEAEAVAEAKLEAAAQAAAASAREAQALRSAAVAYQSFEAAARRGMAALREQQAAQLAAAQEADQLAISANRLRASIDPSFAAQQRFNREIADAQLLISKGAITLDEYVAKLRIEKEVLDATNAAQLRGASSAGAHRAAMQGLSFQAQDVFTQLSMGANPLQVLAIQGGQAAGQMAGLGGSLGKVADFIIGPWGLAITGGLLLLGQLTKGLFDNSEASAQAAAALKSFQDRQSDIGNFIDATTGKIIEQNRNLVQNAILLRRAQIDENAGKIKEQGKDAFSKAGRAAVGGTSSVLAAAFNGEDVQADPAILRVIRAANGDVARLDLGLQALAKRRPDLRNVVLGISNAAAQTILLARENQKLSKEVDLLSGKTGTQATVTSSLIEKQVALQTATTPLARARAQLALVQERAAAADKAGGAALAKYRVDLTAATMAVNAAETAQKSAADARRASRREDSAAAKDLREQQRAYEALVKSAKDYADGQLIEGDRIGKTAKDLRLMEDAARRAVAPTEELKRAIDKAATSREASYSRQAAQDFEANILKPLRDEIALRGLVGAARELAALGLEKEAFLAKNSGDGIVIAMQRWQDYYALKKKLIDQDDAAARETENLRRIADEFDRMASAAHDAGNAIAHAFGRVGNAVADTIDIMIDYRKRQDEIDAAVKSGALTQADSIQQSSALQLQSITALVGAAKGLFREHSKGYKAMEAAEKALSVVQVARTAIAVANGAANMFADLGPLGFPAVAAMLGVMASLGFSGGGSSKKPPVTNKGTGTVLGDRSATSESLKRSIDLLKEVDTLTATYARQMAASLKSIDNQIGNFAALVVRAGNVDASAGVTEGFKTNAYGKLLSGGTSGLYLGAIGSLIGGPIGGVIGTVLGAVTNVVKKIPIIGDIVGAIGTVFKSLFGTKTTIVGSGIFGGDQTLGSVLSGGYDASYYTDVKKKKKFLGITSGVKYKTLYADADPDLERQFTLILRQFNDAIVAAAGPLGQSTDVIQQRLNNFVVKIGKIDLKGLTGQEIEDKLTAVFGAAADDLANAAFPGFERFQKVGEGAFETLVRVATTVEQVTNSLDLLGQSTVRLSLDNKVALADQFDSLDAMSSAIEGYFSTYYTKEEQAAAKTAQFTKVFASLGLALPDTLADYRALVEAQNLTTQSGQETYATLLKLAPAFAELEAAMNGAKSAADVLAERQDLQRQLLELQGDTQALRALDLAKLDVSNRALQERIYALQDAKEAATAAEELRQAWTSVGDSIMTEVKRIRGLTGGDGASFATLLGQFNAATSAARGGDQEAAKSLPGLSQALLKAAEDAATSRQELQRIQAQTAASLEQTNSVILALANGAATSGPTAIDAAAGASDAASAPAAANDDLIAEVIALRDEIVQLRGENASGHAATAGNTAAIKKHLDTVTQASGGEAISVTGVAA
jgi:hypothetical protein